MMNSQYDYWSGRHKLLGVKTGYQEVLHNLGIQPTFSSNCKWSGTFNNCIKIFLINKKLVKIFSIYHYGQKSKFTEKRTLKR